MGGSANDTRSYLPAGNAAAPVHDGESSARARGRMMRATWLVSFVLLYLLLSDRIFVQMDTGGRGVLTILPMLLPPVAVLFTIVSSRGRDARLFRSRFFWAACGIYALTSMLLPLAAVLGQTYSLRVLLACAEGATAVSLVLVGYSIGQCGPAAIGRLKSIIYVAILVHAVCAIMQFLYTTGLGGGFFIDGLSHWDQNAQAAYSDSYVLYGRSVGLFLNPNVLGFWSVIAFWAAAILLQRRRRVIGIGAAVVSLALSQSRGSAAGLLVSLLVFASFRVVATLSRKKVRRSTGRTALVIILLLVPICTAVAYAFAGASSGPRLALLDSMVDRFRSAWISLSTGSAADENLRARVEVWSKALIFLRDRPWGTFGPPQVQFGYSIDNEYIRVALQGGATFVLALVLTFGTLIVTALRHRPDARFLGFATLAIAVNAWTALPVNSVPMGVIWLFLGVLIAADSGAYLGTRTRRVFGRRMLVSAKGPGIVLPDVDR